MGAGEQSEAVPVELVVQELTDSGVVDCLVEAVVRDQLPITGKGGLLTALAHVVAQRVATGGLPDRPVQVEICWHADDQITVTCNQATTAAIVRDLCIQVAARCAQITADLPLWFLRDGTTHPILELHPPLSLPLDTQGHVKIT